MTRFAARPMAPLEWGDDEAPDVAMDGYGDAGGPNFVAAPAQAPVRARLRGALPPHRVDYLRSLAELIAWLIAGAWLLRKVLAGEGGHALDAVARSKAPH